METDQISESQNIRRVDDSDFYKISREDIIRLLNSQFRIKWQFKSYAIRDIKNRITVAMGFDKWVDALVFLKEKAKVI